MRHATNPWSPDDVPRASFPQTFRVLVEERPKLEPPDSNNKRNALDARRRCSGCLCNTYFVVANCMHPARRRHACREAQNLVNFPQCHASLPRILHGYSSRNPQGQGKHHRDQDSMSPGFKMNRHTHLIALYRNRHTPMHAMNVTSTHHGML
ncbi:hypothetical protein LX36DRAFT_446467 [Colletotrichum falcatum]|nr:hypothetical protein LX36DRAFT_446467 [Colletotrichum falcatum]